MGHKLGEMPFIQTKVKSSAKVIDVIGYICYIYTKQNRQPPLQPNVDVYSLYLCKKSLGRGGGQVVACAAHVKQVVGSNPAITRGFLL